MKLLTAILSSLLAISLLSSCSSKPAVSEEQPVSVAPQLPEPVVTDKGEASSTPAPPLEEKTTKKTETKKSKKSKKKST